MDFLSYIFFDLMNVYFFFMKKCDHLIHFGLILALLQMKMFDSSDPLKGFNTYK